MTNQKTGIVAYRAAIAAKYLDVKNYCLKNILAIFVGYCLTDRAHLQVDHLYLSDHSVIGCYGMDLLAQALVSETRFR